MLKRIFLILFTTLTLFTTITAAWAKLPYIPIHFPRDDAAHFEDATPLSEWWYFNGKVTTAEGRQFGYYVIYIYEQMKKNGVTKKLPAFLVQITDLDKKTVYGSKSLLLPIRVLDTRNLDVMFSKDLTLQNNDGTYLINVATTASDGKKIRLSLQLTPARPVLFNGETGYCPAWGGSSMYYYSQPHLKTSGFLQLNNEKFIINSEKSLSWMNRQWLDYLVNHGVTEWLWANAQLDNGMDLDLWLAYDLEKKGSPDHQINILMPDGTPFHTKNITYTAHDHPGHAYPQTYDLDVPEIDLHLTFNAAVPGQDLNGFWEGISNISGTYKGNPIQGHGYTENMVTQK